MNALRNMVQNKEQLAAMRSLIKASLTIGRTSDLLSSVITDTNVVAEIKRAVGKKRNKHIKAAELDNLLASLMGFNNTNEMAAFFSSNVSFYRKEAWHCSDEYGSCVFVVYVRSDLETSCVDVCGFVDLNMYETDVNIRLLSVSSPMQYTEKDLKDKNVITDDHGTSVWMLDYSNSSVFIGDRTPLTLLHEMNDCFMNIGLSGNFSKASEMGDDLEAHLINIDVDSFDDSLLPSNAYKTSKDWVFEVFKVMSKKLALSNLNLTGFKKNEVDGMRDGQYSGYTIIKDQATNQNYAFLFDCSTGVAIIYDLPSGKVLQVSFCRPVSV